VKAVVIREFGGPDVLRLEDVPDPVPGPGDVVVQVHAVSVNRVLDVAMRNGEQRHRGVTLPLIPGVDPSGVIVAVGDGVEDRAEGDRVAVLHRIRCGQCDACVSGDREACSNRRMVGLHRDGGDAELIRIPAESTLPIPDDLGFPEATVISRHAPTAYKLLVHMADVQPGDDVLVMGAGGNLGSLGVQIAKMRGARVIAAAGSAGRVRLGTELGADVGVDYSVSDLTEAVLDATGGRGVDVVYDNIANPTTLPKAVAAMARHGRLVTAGAHGGPLVTLDFGIIYDRQLTIMGGVGARLADYAPCFEAAARGDLKAQVGRIMPLRDIALAHHLTETCPDLGKVILDPTLDGDN
jgi:NADPH:quinone reductase-like Zn-dependent oxidoreductase|tara:strand:- start:10316 stop:11371 length:1056 start_codon:yes stop_codon:yes gene_type:complete